MNFKIFDKVNIEIIIFKIEYEQFIVYNKNLILICQLNASLIQIPDSFPHSFERRLGLKRLH